MTYTKILSTKTLKETFNNVKYAVRGSIPARADAINVELQNGIKHPFKKIINCNIGNPQQLLQPPISFIRQVISLVEYPTLLEDSKLPLTRQLYPRDAIARAKSIMENLESVGAYTHAQGISMIRKHVAEFIEKRDGYPADPDSIFLTTGASPGVQLILNSIIQHPNVGVMIPIPQYPLYTASISLFNGTAVKYYLNEEMEWGLSVEELTDSLNKAKADGVDVRAFCVINPGNPTGQCLSEKNIVEIIDFCHTNNLIIIADEVYQSNAYYLDHPFHSFKKVLKSMGEKYARQELISFHSISKGMIGECGRRGGYYECVGIDPEVMKCFYKIASISLCPPVTGQIAVDLMVKPPQKGDESYDTYISEIDAIYQSLARRSKKLSSAFNSLPGVTCNDAQGAMYVFPQITLPPKAVKAAKLANQEPDEFYCMRLLEETGVCVVPGSGFLQKAGTWHFRCTFLPKEDDIVGFIASLKGFHVGFIEKYK